MTDRLSLYNGALRLCGERRLASLSENREPRRLLDDIWGDNAVNACLEQGQWVFATRAVQLDYSPSVEPPFGYQYAFDLPEDHIRTVALCVDEFFKQPLLEYSQEAGFIFSHLQTVYMKYVSDDIAFGLDMSLWPETFVKFVQSYLAVELAPRLKNGSDLDKLDKAYKKARTESLSRDAMESPTKFAPPGSWVQARRRGMWTDRNRT